MARNPDDARERSGTAGSPPPSIDQLRERLKALGYLDAPVDRYVLGSASSRAGAARFAMGAGLRVGIIAGLLLGISAAIALAVRAPGFIATRRDALVLAGALVALFTVVTAIAVTATVMAASWFARRSASLNAARARRIAATAGVLVALACAAYLTLWWNAAQEVFTAMTFGWNAAALAIAAIVSLLLAHVVSVVILAALARARRTEPISAGGLLSSRSFLVAFGVLLFAGSGALLAMAPGRDGDARNAPAITVSPTGYALRVLAIDGVDLDVVQRLRSAGSLPALSRLFEGGYLPMPREDGAAADPARDWTTIATGQPAAIHGIASLEARRAVGIGGRVPAARGALMESLVNTADLLRLTTPAVASGRERRVPAFWEVAAAAGLRTTVVNWWATWPAPEGSNVVISDRALLRLDTGGALDAEIAPASVYDALRTRWAAMRQAASNRANAAFASVADPEVRRVMVRSAEIDVLVAGLSNVSEGGPVDLRVAYFPGLDIAQFNLLQSPNASVSAMSDRVAAIESYYRFLDDLIAPLIAPSASHIDAAILWPGRAGAPGGAMVIDGGPIVSSAAGCEDCESSAPATLLYLLGLPIAENMQGGPMTSFVTPDFLERHRVRRIQTYDAAIRRPIARTGQPLDAEALERLRSLGYIR